MISTSISSLDCWMWKLVGSGNNTYGKLWKRVKERGRNIIHRQVCEKFGLEEEQSDKMEAEIH